MNKNRAIHLSNTIPLPEYQIRRVVIVNNRTYGVVVGISAHCGDDEEPYLLYTVQTIEDISDKNVHRGFDETKAAQYLSKHLSPTTLVQEKNDPAATTDLPARENP